MTSLLDIGDLTEPVTINGKPLDVRGITPEGFFYLLAKFPSLNALFMRGRASLTMTDLQNEAPDCVAYVNALATTDRSAYETADAWKNEIEAMAAIARRLSAHHQAAIFDVALRLTFPDGVGPFMQVMDKLAKSINRASGQKMAPDTTSSKRSRTGFVTDSLGMKLGRGAPIKNSAH